MSQYDKARDLLSISWKDRPQAEVCVALGELEAQVGRVNEARKVFEEGTKKVTKDLNRVYRAWAKLETMAGQKNEVIEDLLLKAIECNPKDTQAHTAWAQLKEKEVRDYGKELRMRR